MRTAASGAVILSFVLLLADISKRFNTREPTAALGSAQNAKRARLLLVAVI